MIKKSTFYTLAPNYDYSEKKKKFDIKSKNISKDVGNFPKYLNSLKNSLRSNNPIFNLCGNGFNASKIFKNCSSSAFGFDSAWHRLYERNCEMIFIGCDLSKCTFIRFIEFNFGVPYIYNKFFKQSINSRNKKINHFSISSLRYLNSNIKYNTKKFENILLKKDYLKKAKNKNFNFMKIKMKDAFNLGIQELNKDPFFFLEKKPTFDKNFTPYN